MATLQCLAPELLDSIFQYFELEPLPTDPCMEFRVKDDTRQRDLLSLCLVSKKICNSIHRILYCNVVISGGEQAVLFLRTLWTSPHLRAYPRHFMVLCGPHDEHTVDGVIVTWREIGRTLTSQPVDCNKVVIDAISGHPQLNLAAKERCLAHLQREFDDFGRTRTEEKQLARKIIDATLALLEKADDVFLYVPGGDSDDTAYNLSARSRPFDSNLHPIIRPPKTLRMRTRGLSSHPIPTLKPLYFRFLDIGRGTKLEIPNAGTVTRLECHSDDGDWSSLFGCYMEDPEKQLGALPIVKKAELDRFAVLEDLRLYNSRTKTNDIYLFMRWCTNLRTLHWTTYRRDSVVHSYGQYKKPTQMDLIDALNPASGRLRRLHLEPWCSDVPYIASPMSLAHFSVLTYLAVGFESLMGNSGSKRPALSSLLPRSLVDLVAIDRVTIIRSDNSSRGTDWPSKQSDYRPAKELQAFAVDCPTTHPNIRTVTLKVQRQEGYQGDGFANIVDTFAKVGIAFSWEDIQIEPGSNNMYFSMHFLG